MLLRVLATGLCALLLGLPSAARATPSGQAVGATIEIPFDPPIGENLRYRHESTDTQKGRTTITWAVDRYRFDEADSGYRLTVEPVSAGSNESDPRKKEVLKRLEELTKRPFILRLDESGQIIEIENADEYWTKITQALRDVLSSGNQTAEMAGVVETVLKMFDQMPPAVRLAKLTEPIQPLFEFANTRTTEAQPIHEQVETETPFGGMVKQDIVISLTDVSDGLAHLTIRATIPRAELERLTAAFLEKFSGDAVKPDQIEKAKAVLAAMKDFKSETVADYRVWIEDGLLESFFSTQTISLNEGKETQVRIKTSSLKRLD
jgi:hypothetical protein